MLYSPNGNYLAVGSHDWNIYIYDVSKNYGYKGYLKGNTGAILSFDWSADSQNLRSNSAAYELLFFNVDSMTHDPNGASNHKST